VTFFNYSPDGTLKQEDFNHLTNFEKNLFYSYLNENKEENIFSVEKNWGIITFKPPRASLYLITELKEALFTILEKNNIKCLGQHKVESLTKKHILVMYPGDCVMPYWPDLESRLLHQPALYFLIASNESKDIISDIELIKGWYKIDTTRGRLIKSKGLRAVFRQLVEKHEGFFEEISLGSKKYEDSGIHAPCSLRSRFLQLLGFMAVDSCGAEWARSCLKWLNKSKSGEV